MSKKTLNIYKSLDSLNLLNSRLNQICSKNSIDFQQETKNEIENISFEMGQELKSLKFWIESLYSFNGKSTSKAKKVASRQNGMKGGRPPKEITQIKNRIFELEETLIPDLEHSRRMSDDQNFLLELDDKIIKANKEKRELELKLTEWEYKKTGGVIKITSV